jgi:hypothetical protein
LVSDFGLAARLNAECPLRSVETPGEIAPEILAQRSPVEKVRDLITRGKFAESLLSGSLTFSKGSESQEFRISAADLPTHF